MALKKVLSHLYTHRNVWVLSLLYTVGLLFILRHCYYLLPAGGGNWQTADWLINNELVTVRRGCFGSGLFFVADLLGLNPLPLLIAFQAACTSCIFFSLWYAGIRLKNYDNIFFLLISPLLILFWFLDTMGALRKEILGYSAFLPCLFVAGTSQARRVAAVILSCAIYLVAVFSHEVNIFFAPFLSISAILTSRNGQDCVIRDARSIWKFFTGSRYALGVTLAYLLIAAAGVQYFLSYTTIKDTTLVCQPVLAIPGIHEDICAGAIAYLAKDAGSAFSLIAQDYFSNAACIRSFILTWLVSLALFCLYFSRYISLKRTVIYYTCSFCLFIPLFFVSADWGRLFNHHIYCLSCTFLVYMTARHAARGSSGRTFHTGTWLVLLLVFCSFGMHHSGIIMFDTDISYLRSGCHFIFEAVSLLCAAF